MNEFDARILKVLEQLGLDDFDDFRFVQRQEVSHVRNVGIKLIRYIEEKMEKRGMTWGLYSAAYYREHKDVIRGYGKQSGLEDQFDRLVAVLERIDDHLRTIAIYGK